MMEEEIKMPEFTTYVEGKRDPCPVRFVFMPDGKEHTFTIKISPYGNCIWKQDDEEEFHF